MSAQLDRPIVFEDERQRELNRRLEAASWGLFLIMLGGIWLVPAERIPEGTWLVGAGLIMLGLNAARFAYGIKVSVTTLGLGVFAVILGIGDFVGMDLPFFPILLIVIGASLILQAWLNPLLEKEKG